MQDGGRHVKRERWHGFACMPLESGWRCSPSDCSLACLLFHVSLLSLSLPVAPSESLLRFISRAERYWVWIYGWNHRKLVQGMKDIDNHRSLCVGPILSGKKWMRAEDSEEEQDCWGIGRKMNWVFTAIYLSHCLLLLWWFCLFVCLFFCLHVLALHEGVATQLEHKNPQT